MFVFCIQTDTSYTHICAHINTHTHAHALWRVVLATRKIVRPRALHLIGCCVYVQVAVALLVQRPNPCSLTVLGGRWCFLSLGGRCSGVRGSSDPLLKQRLTRLRTRTRRALITHELTHHLCFDRCDLVLVLSRRSMGTEQAPFLQDGLLWCRQCPVQTRHRLLLMQDRAMTRRACNTV